MADKKKMMERYLSITLGNSDMSKHLQESDDEMAKMVKERRTRLDEEAVAAKRQSLEENTQNKSLEKKDNPMDKYTKYV